MTSGNKLISRYEPRPGERRMQQSGTEMLTTNLTFLQQLQINTFFFCREHCNNAKSTLRIIFNAFNCVSLWYGKMIYLSVNHWYEN